MPARVERISAVGLVFLEDVPLTKKPAVTDSLHRGSDQPVGDLDDPLMSLVSRDDQPRGLAIIPFLESREQLIAKAIIDRGGTGRGGQRQQRIQREVFAASEQQGA